MSSEAELLHYEDLPEGEVVTFGNYEVTEEEVKAYAAEFDPQPFHLDADAAKDSVLGGLCASGWHTCAMMMRMLYDGYLYKSAGLGSFGMEEVKWLKPVMVGDVLSVRRTTFSKRVSAKRPEMGIVNLQWEVIDQTGEVKALGKGVGLFKVRHPGAAA